MLHPAVPAPSRRGDTRPDVWGRRTLLRPAPAGLRAGKLHVLDDPRISFATPQARGSDLRNSVSRPRICGGGTTIVRLAHVGLIFYKRGDKLFLVFSNSEK